MQQNLCTLDITIYTLPVPPFVFSTLFLTLPGLARACPLGSYGAQGQVAEAPLKLFVKIRSPP